MSDMSADNNLIRRWSNTITVPVRKGNSVQYLIDGKDTFKAMYDAIKTTLQFGEHPDFYIYLLGWWLDDRRSVVDS